MANVDTPNRNALDMVIADDIKSTGPASEVRAPVKSCLDVLGLSHLTSLRDIELRWAELAWETHPARGGDANRYQRVRQAYREARLLFEFAQAYGEPVS